MIQKIKFVFVSNPIFSYVYEVKKVQRSVPSSSFFFSVFILMVFPILYISVLFLFTPGWFINFVEVIKKIISDVVN